MHQKGLKGEWENKTLFWAIPWPGKEAEMMGKSLSGPGIFLRSIPATVDNMKEKDQEGD